MFFVSVNIELINQELRKVEDTDHVAVKDLCEVNSETSVGDLTNYNPQVVFFRNAGVPEIVMEHLSMLETAQTSHVRKQIWIEACTLWTEPCTPADVIEHICKPYLAR